MEAEDSKAYLWVYEDFHATKNQVYKQSEYPAIQKFYYQGFVIQNYRRSVMCVCTHTHIINIYHSTTHYHENIIITKTSIAEKLIK